MDEFSITQPTHGSSLSCRAFKGHPSQYPDFMPGVPSYPIFSVFAFIGFLLAGFPIPWHLQSWNIGVCMYMVWASLGCLILFVNSVVWNDNVTNWAPVWCDISARYLIGGSVGIPASSLCIIRRLYYITKLQTLSVERNKRREVIVDVSIGIGFPCVIMVLQYIVQGDRFDIYEQIGCYPSVISTPAAFLLLLMWPLIIGLISFIYAVLTFRRAFLQKERLKKELSAGFSIDAGYYWRLMAACSVEIIFTIPLSLYNIIFSTVTTQVTPYVSWAWIHSDISRVGQYPAVVWQNTRYMAIGLESTRWSYILCAFLIFAFFGLGRQMRDFYWSVVWSVCQRLGYSRSSTSSLSIPTTALKQMNDHQHARSGQLSLPFKVQLKKNTSQISLPFEARPRPDSLSSSFGHSANEILTGSPSNLC